MRATYACLVQLACSCTNSTLEASAPKALSRTHLSTAESSPSRVLPYKKRYPFPNLSTGGPSGHAACALKPEEEGAGRVARSFPLAGAGAFDSFLEV